MLFQKKSFLKVLKNFSTQTSHSGTTELLVVPILVLLISIMCLIIYTNTTDPYTVAIQTLVFMSILILNLGIFSFYKGERKLSFMFFVCNCLLIFMYIRLSTNTTFPISLIYYAIIFIGFHIFEETFTKKFYLRTKIILTGYYNNSEFIKIVLWFFLILIPSLIKHPIIISTVYQPLMVYCYLFKYDYILLFLSIIILWCLLLVLMNKYKIARNFLETCKRYFSRRACLHYVGNMFGSTIRKAFQGVNPYKVAGNLTMAIGVSYIPGIYDFRNQLHETGVKAAKAAKNLYENNCIQSNIEIDSYQSYAKQLTAYNDSVKNARHGNLFLNLKMVGLKIPDELDIDTFNSFYEDQTFREKHNLEVQTKSFEDLRQVQMESRMEFKKQLIEKCKNTDDLYKVCRRSLDDLAKTKGLILNKEQFDTIKNELTSQELIDFVIEEFKKADEQFIESYKKKFDNSIEQSLDDKKPLLSPTSTDKNFYDLELLDNTTDRKLSKDDVTLQVKLPSKTVPGQPNTNESMTESIYEKPKSDSLESSSESSSKKRSIGESLSTDTSDSLESNSSSKKPKNLKHK